MNNQQVTQVLSYLYRIVEAGEKGYAVSAANMHNPGLKVLFKSYAQQRARFKSEVLAEINRLGGSVSLRSSIRGVLHRGRIGIFATLATGNESKEKIVLNEIMIGERVALNAYETTLKKDLPIEVCELLKRQYEDVVKVTDQVSLIRGGERRLMVRMFEAETDADVAVNEMKKAGIRFDSIERISIRDSIELYKSRGTTVFETSLSGAVGGALWGSLIGALAGLGAQETAALGTPAPMYDVWSLVALAGILAGAFVGGFLGFVIGIGISEEDNYQYDQSMEHGRTILLVLAEVSDAFNVGQVMERVNLEAKALLRNAAV